MKSLTIKTQITNRETGSVDSYLKDISKYKLIDSEKEIELSKKIKKGDTQAMNELIKANLRFVISVAKQYQNMGLEFEDLIAEGNIGLIKASQKFDETRGFKFISYAVWWIRQSILNAIAEKSRVVYLPLNKINLLVKINNSISKLNKELGREVTTKDISEDIDVKEETVLSILKHSNNQLSMDHPINEDGDDFYSVFENTSAKRPDADMLNDSLKRNIKSVLNTLSDRESFILRKHFGLDNETPMSLNDISELLNLTKERVRQIKQKSLYKIKNSMRSSLLI
jgi:RNA polymerase primary sigma factor